MTPGILQLATLDGLVAERVASVRAVRPAWPCRRGCDACCRSLAHPLELTAAEWTRVDDAVAALDAPARASVEARASALVERMARGGERGPVVCPYLDEASGACRIYEARPLACRTYGFYVGRDGPEHCTIIEGELAERGEAGIVWGNAASLAARVSETLGPAIPFDEHRRRR